MSVMFFQDDVHATIEKTIGESILFNHATIETNIGSVIRVASFDVLMESKCQISISEVLYRYQNKPDIYNMIEGRREVKAACLKEVQEAMLKETGKPVVEKVLFTDFVMQ